MKFGNTPRALLLLALLAGCGEVKKQDDKTVFRYNEPGGISSLDPAFARNIENLWAVNQIFNGLVQMTSQLEVVPAIAHKWSVSADGLVYTLQLRDDVFFHDHDLFPGGNGRRVTAYDFVYSFNRIVDPVVASPGTWIFNYLERSEENNYMGFSAKDDRTFKIYLNKPFPPFLGILTMAYCAVVPKEVVEYYGQDFRRNPIGTGPFMFKVWEEGTKVILTRNNNYFERDEDGEQLPYLDAVSISFVKDQQLAFLDFMGKKYDFMSGLEGSYKDKVYTREGDLQPDYEGKFEIQKLPYLKTDYLGILIDEKIDIVKDSPLKIKEIRKAINYAFDRVKMVKFLRNNIGVPATSGFIPRGMPSYSSDKVKGYTYDPEKARALLSAAGFPDGKNLPPIELTTTIDFQNLCEYIQHAIGEIGIKASVNVIDEATYREMVAQSKLNVFRKSWIADYPDSENFLALFYSKNHSPTGPNYSHYNNYKFDKLYERAMAENDPEKRYAYYQQMDQMVIDDAPVIPLYYDEVSRFVHFHVQGLESNPMNLLVLKRVKMKNP